MLQQYTIQTEKRDQMIEVTNEVQEYITKHGLKEGVVIIYCPHTTAGITINENADPDVKTDMLRRFDEVYPWNTVKDLHAEGNSAAHMKASTVGSSQTVYHYKGQVIIRYMARYLFL